MYREPVYSGFGHRKTMKIAKFQGRKRKTNKEDIKNMNINYYFQHAREDNSSVHEHLLLKRN